jgi:hypothetical protein
LRRRMAKRGLRSRLWLDARCGCRPATMDQCCVASGGAASASSSLTARSTSSQNAQAFSSRASAAFLGDVLRRIGADRVGFELVRREIRALTAGRSRSLAAPKPPANRCAPYAGLCGGLGKVIPLGPDPPPTCEAICTPAQPVRGAAAISVTAQTFRAGRPRTTGSQVVSGR